MSKKIVVRLTQLNDTEDYGFIGYDDEVGLLLVTHDGQAQVFVDIGEGEYTELMDTLKEEGAPSMEAYFLSEYGESAPIHAKGRTLFALSGAQQVSFPFTQSDDPLKMILVSLRPHLNTDGGVEWVRDDDKRFPSNKAGWLLPQSASPDFLEGLREILLEEGIPPQMARRRADGKSRLVTVGLPTSITYVMEAEEPEEEPEDEPEIEVIDLGSALGQGGDEEDDDGELEIIDLTDQPKPEKTYGVQDLPAKAQDPLERGRTHGIRVRLGSKEDGDIYRALVALHMAFAEQLEIPLTVMLSRDIPPHIIKTLVEGGVQVSRKTPPAPGSVGVQLEPGRPLPRSTKASG